MAKYSDPPPAQKKNLVEEYSATCAAYLHYDNFTWQVGSILFAGVFVYWGILLNSHPELLVINLSNLFVCSLLSVWILYSAHNRQIYLYKLHRIHELEKELSFYQNRRFKDWPGEPKIYITSWPSGHVLSEALYILISIGSLILGWNVKYYGTWSCLNWLILFLVPIIVLIVSIRIHIVEKFTRSILENLNKNNTPSA